MESDGDDLTSSGSLFHDEGPKMVNACLAIFGRCLRSQGQPIVCMN